MKRVALGCVLMSTLSVTHGMESPLTHKVEISGSVGGFSETNSGASGMSDPIGSPIGNLGKEDQFAVTIPPLTLNNPMEIKSCEKEQLLEMALLGVEHYEADSATSTVASFYFDTILKQKPEVKELNPKSVAIAHLYMGKMAFKMPNYSWDSEQIKKAHQCLKNAARQTTDLQVATQARAMLARVYYIRGTTSKEPELVRTAVGICEQVVSEACDDKAVLEAKTILSDASQMGHGMERNSNRAFALMREIACQNKYPRAAFKGQLQCALLLMEGIDREDWNFEHYGVIDAYLTRPRFQKQFEDLKQYAEILHQKLQAKAQDCDYQEGLAYLRRALPVNGYYGARLAWDAFGKKGIKALQDLKTKSPSDYMHVLNQAEYYFERAAYEEYSPTAKTGARKYLAWIYKETNRRNKFEELEKAIKEMHKKSESN